MIEMTKPQRKIYDYLVTQCHDGTPPTIREIQAMMGVSSPNGIVCHLRALKRKGLIEMSENKARSIRPVRAEVVVKRTKDAVLLTATGPVSFTPDEWKQWLASNWY